MPTRPMGQTESSRDDHIVQFTGGKLTVKVTNSLLVDVLRQIARQSGLTLILSGTLMDQITEDFDELSLDRALRRLLRHQSFVVEYAQHQETRAPHPATLWVLASRARLLAKTRAAGHKEAALLQRHNPQKGNALPEALTGRSTEDRAVAVALGRSGHPDAIPAFADALTGEDKGVREAAIDGLTNVTSEQSIKVLAATLQDPDASLREEAVEALWEIGGQGAISLLQQALQDKDEFVRDTAEELLTDLTSHVR